VGRTKQQWHEAVVQFASKQSVTKGRRVSVPFGDRQCVAICHRIESGREVDDFESRSSRQANHFASTGLFLSLEIYRFRTEDNQRMNPALLALLGEALERPFIHFVA
jgi:hypothetical protein